MKPYERFLNYVAFPTMSDEKSETVPSTEKQVVLSLAIAAELMSMGLADVELDDKGYLYATLPANTDKKCPTIGLVAHVDTSDACADAPIAAKIVAYEGGDICLNEQKG
ncbi:MAG: peptidase T, partial [Ruminococcaceae bacterium]|nr:peptidase T [Oscillospiraceae bacterium]